MNASVEIWTRASLLLQYELCHNTIFYLCLQLREYELNEIFHHSEDDKKYDVIGIEDQHLSQHNSIPVLNNNDIAEEIEEQRHEVELQMLNESPR